ncbi:unnamed protein product, partial [Brassica oleracea var. botrytis]
RAKSKRAKKPAPTVRSPYTAEKKKIKWQPIIHFRQ